MRTRVRAHIVSTDALGDHPLVASTWVVSRDLMNAHVRCHPFGIEGLSHLFLPGLIAAAVADESDVEKSMLLEATSGIFKDFAEHVLGQRDRTGKPHVPGRWVDVALGDVGNHWRDERIPETSCDLAGFVFHKVVVFPKGHVGPVLLGTARRDDDGCLTRGNYVTDFHPRQIFEEDTVGLRHGRGLRR